VNMPVVTTISSYAFRGCARLTSVSLPATLTSIGDNPFAGCTSLTSLPVDPGNTYLKVENGMLLSYDGKKLVSYTTATGTVELNSPIESIGNGAFYASALTSVTSTTVTSIGNYAFYGCTKLESVSLPSAASIGSEAFYNCITMVSVSFPLATSIGNYAFYNCYKLESADFPKATSIGSSVFYSCVNLITLKLSSAPPTLGNSVFYYTSNSNANYTTLTIKLPAAEDVVKYTSAWSVPVSINAKANTSSKYGDNHKAITITGGA
jgi:hypothetical protein